MNDEIKNLLGHHVFEFSSNKWYEDTFSLAERWLFDVYEMAAFRPLWLKEPTIRPDVAVLVDYLLNAGQHGLKLRTYGGEDHVTIAQLRLKSQKFIHDSRRSEIPGRQEMPVISEWMMEDREHVLQPFLR